MIEVALDDGVEGDAATAAVALIESALTRMLAAHDRADADLVVVLCGDARIAELHEQFLGIAGPTDVLSFPDEDDPTSLGEVYLSMGVAARVAADRGHDTADEALLYAVHGSLHLLGYDDHDDDDRAAMREAERRYAGRDGDA